MLGTLHLRLVASTTRAARSSSAPLITRGSPGPDASFPDPYSIASNSSGMRGSGLQTGTLLRLPIANYFSFLCLAHKAATSVQCVVRYQVSRSPFQFNFQLNSIVCDRTAVHLACESQGSSKVVTRTTDAQKHTNFVMFLQIEHELQFLQTNTTCQRH